MSIFETGLAPSAVNHIALSPLSFIERTASVYGEYPAGDPRRHPPQLARDRRTLPAPGLAH